jgi:hypothetical protein
MPKSSKNPEHVETGRLGGLTAATNADRRGERHQRMEHVRANSPSSDAYYAKQLGFGLDPEQWTAGQRRQIATAKALYFARLRRASVAEMKRLKAERLQKQAAAIDAELAAEAGSDG